MGWLGNLFSPTVKDMPSVAELPHWPTAEEITLSRKYNTSYGQPEAAWVQPQPPAPAPVQAPSVGPAAALQQAMARRGVKTTVVTPAPAPVQASNYAGLLRQLPTPDATLTGFRALEADINPLPLITPKPMNDTTADQVTAAYLASRKSAISALGFDPTRSLVGTDPNAANIKYSLGGEYSPGMDALVTTGASPSTLTHESFHRGIEKMRQAGVYPAEAAPLSEEALVRALMQRSVGMVEKGRGAAGDSQVADGAFYNSYPEFSKKIDAVEKAAASYRAKQTPGGPR